LLFSRFFGKFYDKEENPDSQNLIGQFPQVTKIEVECRNV